MTPEKFLPEIHRHFPPVASLRLPSDFYTQKRAFGKNFLTTSSSFKDWEYDNTRIQNLEQQMGALISQMAQAGDEAAGLKQALDFYKAQGGDQDQVRLGHF